MHNGNIENYKLSYSKGKGRGQVIKGHEGPETE